MHQRVIHYTLSFLVLSLGASVHEAQSSLVKLVPSGTTDEDWLVHSAVDGDAMVVGSLFGDGAAPGSGAVHVYRRAADGNWNEEAELIGSDVGPGFWFGKHVAIDGACIVVGAPQEWLGTTGAAYVFRHDGNSWRQEAKLLPGDMAADGRFGAGVSVHGDRIIVGAYLALQGIGQAYVYERDGGQWVERARLPSPGGVWHFASHSVAIWGDHAIAGSPFDPERGDGAGAAFTYRRVDGTWMLEQKLLADDGVASDQFGWWADSDGNQVIVGAPEKEQMGAVYIFERAGSKWVQAAKLLADDAGPGDAFGYWCSIEGEWAAVGARGADASGLDSGAAYLFHREGGVWSQHSKVVAPDTASGDQFGFVSLDEETVTFGALGNDNAAGINAGAIYVKSLPTSVTPPVASFTGSPLRGKAPLVVRFADLSTGIVTERIWDFGNGYYSTVQNPILTFFAPGTYNIALTVSGPGGLSTLVRHDYIEVLPRGPSAQPSSSP